MNRLSAIDAIGPAFTRVGELLFKRFRLGVWIKFGFIGLLGGGLVTASTGLRTPFPGGNNNPSEGQFPGGAPDLERILHSIHLGQYFHIFINALIAFAVIGLVLQYLFCRFRFILFDTVISGQPVISRGWNRYGSQANRYFGFWLVYRLVNWAVMMLIIGLPLWRAYKAGLFNGEGSFPLFLAMAASIGFGTIIAGLVFAVISTLMKDFVLPVLALDDFTLGDAWSAVWRVVASEPGAWAGYMGLKFACAVATGIALVIAFLFALLPSIIVIGIPVAVVIGIGIAVVKMGSMVVGVIICSLGGLLAAAGVFCLFMILSAPVSVFFASYAFYFFGGRYPKLAALLWPQPAVIPPQPLGTQPAL